MKRILIYRHPECERCARFARMHALVDWLDRVDGTTAEPPTGALRPGQIVVKDLRTGEFTEGADALRLIYRNVIPYWPLLVLLWIPWTKAYLEREVRGGAAAPPRRLASATGGGRPH